MKKYLLLLMFLAISVAVFAAPADSVGTKVKNGKVYILHKVEKGQGLYSISKMYGAKLSEIVAENPGSETVIKIDQIIWIPTDREVVMEEPVVEDYFERTDVSDIPPPANVDTTESTYATYYQVERGDNLFRIAAKFETTVQVIRELNALKSDVLAIGQRLMVPSNQEEAELPIARPHDDSSYTIDMETETAQLDIEMERLPEPESEDENIEVEGYSIKVTRLEDYEMVQVEETGHYIQAGTTIPENRYWAGHFNAPIGTVILVTNPANGKNVFVKIVENFTRESDSAVILMLSNIAMETIGLESEDQTVELSYAR
jgi:LysM repeat protein